MTQIYIKNAYIITMNKHRDVYRNASILIEHNMIKAIGKIDDSEINSNTEIYDAKGKIILPGLINTHVHTTQQLGRGIADDVNLITWLHDRVWPYESKLDYNDSLLSALACCTELIRSGVTTFLEAGGNFVEAIIEAVGQSGIRACVCKSILNYGYSVDESISTDRLIDEQRILFKNFNNSFNGRVKIWLGLRTIFNNSDDLIMKTKKLANELNTGIHMHVAEVNEEIEHVKTLGSVGTISHLHKLGILGPNLLSVHSVWLNDTEIDLIKLYDVKVSHCPGAAMKVSLGFARIPEMINKHICVSIGTDGAPSNNRMDIFRDMYLASVIHKGRTTQPNLVTADEILEMVTIMILNDNYLI